MRDTRRGAERRTDKIGPEITFQVLGQELRLASRALRFLPEFDSTLRPMPQIARAEIWFQPIQYIRRRRRCFLSPRSHSAQLLGGVVRGYVGLRLKWQSIARWRLLLLEATLWLGHRQFARE